MTNEPSSNEHPMTYHLQVYCLLNSVPRHILRVYRHTLYHTLRLHTFDLHIVAERVISMN